MACFKNNYKVVRVLLDWLFKEKGPEMVKDWVNRPTHSSSQTEDSEGQTEFTPLLYAAFFGNLELIKILEIYNADPLQNLTHRVNIMHTSA